LACFDNLRFGQFLSDPFGFKFCGFAGSFLEFVYSASGVNQILSASIERMAVGANFNTELLLGGASNERTAAGANDLGVREVLWVEIFFHLVEYDTIDLFWQEC
jgi:hypothetical protein